MPRDRHEYDRDDDIDRDPDERYRDRADRYGPEVDDEDEEEQERDAEVTEEISRRKCRGPGILMIVAGVLAMAGNVGFAAYGISNAGTGQGAGVSLFVFAFQFALPLLAGLACGGLQIGGGVCLLRRRVRGLVITGGILGCLPCSAGLVLGIPAALWMFSSLGDPDVQAVFERSKRGLR